jgi:hypothetical protein
MNVGKQFFIIESTSFIYNVLDICLSKSENILVYPKEECWKHPFCLFIKLKVGGNFLMALGKAARTQNLYT